jgi:hypothetical protein
MVTLVVTPAYGRVYKTEAELRQGFIDGRDFHIPGGPYLSIRDFVRNDPSLSDYDSVLLLQLNKNKNPTEVRHTFKRSDMVWPKLFPEDEGEPDSRYTNQDPDLKPLDMHEMIKKSLGYK